MLGSRLIGILRVTQHVTTTPIIFPISSRNHSLLSGNWFTGNLMR
ncbi:MAG: hypothetical protein XE11_0063 [Methanomicrobiales archaeon 53_19]|jgi:hypothetical protein|nr:MAG: hypothetical protein XD88_1853 [Methanocalculus sp. 52_23]KUL05201.1 MAG: hypothetical protein XE11_0063 [Methanomicrobiales archaeon 53_19]